MAAYSGRGRRLVGSRGVAMGKSRCRKALATRERSTGSPGIRCRRCDGRKADVVSEIFLAGRVVENGVGLEVGRCCGNLDRCEKCGGRAVGGGIRLRVARRFQTRRDKIRSSIKRACCPREGCLGEGTESHDNGN